MASKQAPAPNLLLIITDQERATQHFPPGWDDSLYNLDRLRRNGLTFQRAFCAACMCSPSRSTLFTGKYVTQHQVTETLTFGGTFSPTETVLDPTLLNLATMLRPHGYKVHYRGKWHLSKGASEDLLTRADVGIYGFEGWVPPDAGEDVKIQNFGGGYADHDALYVQQAVEFLRDPPPEPWCLVLSLVNPHDVLSFPKTYEFGYDGADLEGDIELPATVDEDLRANQKPSAQAQLKAVSGASLGLLNTPEKQRQYVNFYGNLIRRIDRQLTPVIDFFYDEKGNPKDLAHRTLIVRTADHGEMGMAHGGLRQKAFNTYEETLRVPMVFAHPDLGGKGQETYSLVSLVDLMPTLADYLLGESGHPELSGVSLRPVLDDPSQKVRDEVVFVFDDVRASSADSKAVVAAADRIRCVRQESWKYARYFQADGFYPEELEMYYLGDETGQPEGSDGWRSSTDETHNLASPDNPDYDDPEVKAKRQELERLLREQEAAIVKRHEDA